MAANNTAKNTNNVFTHDARTRKRNIFPKITPAKYPPGDLGWSSSKIQILEFLGGLLLHNRHQIIAT